MNVGDMAIAVRERRIAEIYDLALQVCLRYRLSLLALSLPAVVAFGALNLVLIGALADGDPRRGPLALALILFEGPLLQALITVFLGRAMFSRQVSARASWREYAGRVRALITILLVRGLFLVGYLLLLPPQNEEGAAVALALLLALPLLFAPDQLVPVLMLERLRGREAWRRARSLGAFYRSENISQTLGNGLLTLIGVVAAVWGVCQIAAILQFLPPDATSWDAHLAPDRWWIQGLVLLMLVYFSVVRFCAYLDLRTKREGWALELRLRQAAEQVERVG